jgi:hypothetical protein
VYSKAARGGHLHILVWARENGAPYNEQAYVEAAKEGHTYALEWLRKTGHPLDVGAVCRAATKGGHLEAFRWVMGQEGCRWDEGICASVAEEGHMHILKWARDNGYGWYLSASARAAKARRFEVLRWASDVWPTSWGGTSTSICNAAAQGGHIEILRWARGKGCPWDATMYEHANSFDVMDWAWENGCPWYEGKVRGKDGALPWLVQRWLLHRKRLGLGCPRVDC